MTVTDATSGDVLMRLPYELLEAIFRYLNAADLCKLAVCCRRWRCAVNQDFWWRPLCRRNGYNKDISRQIPYEPQQTCDEGETNGLMCFPMDAIVREENPMGLPSTCKWKEIYMKARHLEANWEKGRCHVTTLKVFSDDDQIRHHARGSDRPFVRCSDGDGDLFVMSFSDGTIKVWNVRRGICERVFRAVLTGRENTVKVKKGIVVAGCTDGLLRAFRVINGQELPPKRGHRLGIDCIFFDGHTVVSRAVSDDDIRVWTVFDGKCRHVLASPHPESSLKELDYRDEIASAIYSDNQLLVWHARSGKCLLASKQPDGLQSVKLGYGTVACLHHGPAGTGVVIRSFLTRECISIPLDDFKASGSHLWIEDFFPYGGLFLRALPHRTYEGACLNVRTRQVHFLPKFGYLKTAFCFHGNRCVLEDRYNYQKNDYYIYRASAEGFKLVRSATHPDDKTGKRLILWMDDTKIIFQNLVQDMKLYVHHYW